LALPRGPQQPGLGRQGVRDFSYPNVPSVHVRLGKALLHIASNALKTVLSIDDRPPGRMLFRYSS
jgi:hypothetical protein